MNEKLKKVLLFIANPRLLLCFGLGWIITNGWSYILLAVGTWLGSGWMMAVAGGYMAFLWFPFTPEKLITVAIAMALLRFLFPNDQKTLGVLKNMYAKLKEALRLKKEQKQNERQRKDADAAHPAQEE